MSDRVFHPYHTLEEFHAGMWRIVRGTKRKDYIAASAELMKCPHDFKEAMIQVLNEWPISCEANLTADMINRIAWLGHAGCCIATGSPEEATRVAWHTLEPDEQDEANRVADEVVQMFLKMRRQQRQMPNLLDMMS